MRVKKKIVPQDDVQKSILIRILLDACVNVYEYIQDGEEIPEKVIEQVNGAIAEAEERGWSIAKSIKGIRP